MINVVGVEKRISPAFSIANISFQVSPGEVVGLMGPNGAGKTSIVRLLTGIYQPDRDKCE